MLAYAEEDEGLILQQSKTYLMLLVQLMCFIEVVYLDHQGLQSDKCCK